MSSLIWHPWRSSAMCWRYDQGSMLSSRSSSSCLHLLTSCPPAASICIFRLTILDWKWACVTQWESLEYFRFLSDVIWTMGRSQTMTENRVLWYVLFLVNRHPSYWKEGRRGTNIVDMSMRRNQQTAMQWLQYTHVVSRRLLKQMELTLSQSVAKWENHGYCGMS